MSINTFDCVYKDNYNIQVPISFYFYLDTFEMFRATHSINYTEAECLDSWNLYSINMKLIIRYINKKI